MSKKELSVFSAPVLVGALGFFVDIYDLLLFSIVRKSSFADLGVSPNEMKIFGEHILSWQMIGLVVGGVIWGVIGDKKGRKSVLFGSILLYSIATLANGVVQNVNQYTLLRFIAGLGLAGELGASITLTSEILPKEKRGLAASIIATSGVMGTITAYFIHVITNNNWRLCYFIGGAMGIILLFLRTSFLESGMYNAAKEQTKNLGNFLMFFKTKERFSRYLKSILIGIPVWYVIGILISFSDEFAKHFNISNFNQPKALMLQYTALAFGDMSAGIISNLLKSRKKTLIIFYVLLSAAIAGFFIAKGGGNAQNMYLFCMALGFGSGISVLYIAMSAEQFGTNLRATAAISIPNMVRGCLPLILLLFQFLRSKVLTDNYITAAWMLGIVVMSVGFMAVITSKETFTKDLNYIEN